MSKKHYQIIVKNFFVRLIVTLLYPDGTVVQCTMALTEGEISSSFTHLSFNSYFINITVF